MDKHFNLSERELAEIQTTTKLCLDEISNNLHRKEADSRIDKIDVLFGWTDIANALGVSVSTVKRYSKNEALPIVKLSSVSSTPMTTRGALQIWVDEKVKSRRKSK